jgi:hypothetical protein
MSVTATASGLSVSAAISIDFSNYGTTVSVTAPPADEVAPFQSFLQAAGASQSSVS